MKFVPKTFTVANVRKVIDLVDILKYGIFFMILLNLLPLSAFFVGSPLHNIIGGIYSDFGFAGVLTASMVLTLTAWSLLYTQGLIIDGIESRYGDTRKWTSDENNIHAVHLCMFKIL